VDLKDAIAADVAAFLNTEEFAETHTVDGTAIVCVLDSDVDGEFAGDPAGGLYVATRRLHCRETDLAKAPVQGKVMTIDETPHLVLDVSNEMGMLAVTLVENSTA